MALHPSTRLIRIHLPRETKTFLKDTQTAGYLMKLVRLYGFTDVDLPVKPIRAAAMMSGCRGDQL